jgi:asparagine synthase (glutamine-hydrolysing)
MAALIGAFGQFSESVGQVMTDAMAYREPSWSFRTRPGSAMVAGHSTADQAEALYHRLGSAHTLIDAPTWMIPKHAAPVTTADLVAVFATLTGDAHCIGTIDDTVVVYRGPISPRPLFYAVTAEGLLVASRPSAITCVNPTEIDRPALASFLIPAMHDTQASAWRGVHRLPPGHALTWRSGTTPVLSLVCTLDGDNGDNVDGADRDELISRFRQRFLSAVDRSSGPSNALLLSGGIDSSVLAAAYDALPDRAVRAYTLSYEPPLEPVDERRYARDVADHNGIHLDSLPANGLLPLSSLHPQADEPEPWAYAGRNWAMLSHIAAGPQIPDVVIAGEGGDELLLGQVFSVADRIASHDPTGAAEIATYPDPVAIRTVVESLLQGTYDTRGARLDRALRDLPPWFTRTWVDGTDVVERLAASYPRLGPPGQTTVSYSRGLIAQSGAAGRVQCGGWWHDTGRRLNLDIAYPYLDPDLVSLIWSLPPALLRCDGFEKVVMREAFSSELAPSVMKRRDKAAALAILDHGLTTNTATLRQAAHESPLYDLGIVDPHRIRVGIENYLTGNRRLGPALWAFHSVHTWLIEEKEGS